MIRTFVAIAVLAKATDAARIWRSESKLAAESTFFESCEDLQGIFRSRVTAVQGFLDTQRNETDISTVARARVTMRVFGVVRTLRRAKDCQWVLAGDSEDIEQSRSIVQSVLAENPCAEAAMAEMTPEAFEIAAYELQPLQRAMIVLMSESCEVPEREEEEVAGPEDEAAMDNLLGEEEAEVQDHIDELFEQALLDSESVAGGSFVETEAKARWGLGFVLRMIGAVFFGVFFAFLCIPVGFAIGAIIGLLFCNLAGPGACGGGPQSALNGIVIGSMVGSAVSFAGCARFLVQELMPRDFSAPTYPTYHQQAAIPFK